MMSLREARRLAVLAQVQMVGPIVLDGFGLKRLKFAVGATASQVNELIEDLERQGEVRFRVAGGQIIVSAVGGAK